MGRRVYCSVLGINHQSPLIHLSAGTIPGMGAGNQSPIPFDTLGRERGKHSRGWESITNPL